MKFRLLEAAQGAVRKQASVVNRIEFVEDIYDPPYGEGSSAYVIWMDTNWSSCNCRELPERFGRPQAGADYRISIKQNF